MRGVDLNNYVPRVIKSQGEPRATFQQYHDYSFPAPYGIQFGEENQVREKERKQYKQDLDYLVGLRKPYGDMTQKEWEEYQRKINYMNDVTDNIFYF